MTGLCNMNTGVNVKECEVFRIQKVFGLVHTQSAPWVKSLKTILLLALEIWRISKDSEVKCICVPVSLPQHPLPVEYVV